MSQRIFRSITPTALLLAVALTGCDDDGVTDEEGARLAYEGLDPSVDKILDLGFRGFSEATSANIPQQSTTGAVSGTMIVNGKVDQGSSNNKGMRLDVDLVNYSDGAVAHADIDDIIYNTQGPLTVDVKMNKLPDADLSGTLVGTVVMDGGLVGPLTFSLNIVGKTMDDGSVGTDWKIRRAPGTVRITGTATSDYGVFNVDVLH
jgi:hypothetical protein